MQKIRRQQQQNGKFQKFEKTLMEINDVALV